MCGCRAKPYVIQIFWYVIGLFNGPQTTARTKRKECSSDVSSLSFEGALRDNQKTAARETNNMGRLRTKLYGNSRSEVNERIGKSVLEYFKGPLVKLLRNDKALGSLRCSRLARTRLNRRFRASATQARHLANYMVSTYRIIPKISPSKYKPPGGLYLENCPQIQSKTKQKW